MKGLVLKELYAAKTTLKSALTSAVLFYRYGHRDEIPGIFRCGLNDFDKHLPYKFHCL